MKISELKVGDNCTIALVVKTATARETKSKKPYLALELFDGIETINGNYWDWPSDKVPAPNTILDVLAQVTEWQGTKQLKVQAIRANNTMTLEDFMPASKMNITDVYKKAYALMTTIKDDTLRDLALNILEELRVMWLTVPGAKSVHHAFVGGTLVHSYNVAKLAGAIAKETPGAQYDLATVGGMLHDLGKLFTYKVDGINIDMTANGMLYEHSFMGAEFVGNFADSHLDTDNPYVYAKVRLLRHIILSHHGKQEYGAPVVPMCIEAYIVHCADELDATTEQIRQAAEKAGEVMWTDRIYTLNNRPHITPTYVEDAFTSE